MARQVPGTYCALILIGTGVILGALPAVDGWRITAFYLAAWILAGIRSPCGRILGFIAPLTAVSVALLYTIDPHLAYRQSLWLLCGAALFVIVRPGVVTWLLHRRSGLLALGILALGVTTFLGKSVGGARSWLSVGIFALQPVQFVKVLLVLYWAPLLAISDREEPRAYQAPLLATSSVLGLLALQRDFGPVLVIVLTALVWAAIAGVRLRYLVRAAIAFGLAGVILLQSYPHLTRRFAAWLTPWSDPFGAGYQSVQARFALANGHLVGNGWHGSFVHVPAVATDLPLVGIVERLGLFGGLLVVALLAGAVTYMLHAAWLQRDMCRRHLGIGCALLFGFESLLAGAGAVGLTPIIGITTPFLSYGGSSLIAGFLLLGLGHSSTMSTKEVKGAALPSARNFRWAAPAVLSVGVPLVYWTLIAGAELIRHPRFVAQRTAVAAEARGGIVSRSGENLTAAVEPGLRQPVLPSLIHTVGYVHPQFGTAGLERTFSDLLTGSRGKAVTHRLFGHQATSAHLRTTLDIGLQEVAEQALGDRIGAIVVLDPWTGAVLAMVSSPRPAAGQVTSLTMEAPDAPLLNRATQGLYPPGSAFKPVVLAAALESGIVTADTPWEDAGTVLIDGYRIRNADGRAHGRLSTVEALAVSSNVVFAQLAVALEEGPLRMQSHAFGIGNLRGLEIPYRAGSLGNLGSRVALAAAGIGQGEILVTPLEMAVVTAVIANGGYRVYPRLVLQIEGEGQLAIGMPGAPTRALRPSTAAILQSGMRQVVAEGTFAGRIDPALLAGKTGTAENPHGEPHAWFIGFAPAVQPVAAFAIVVEHGGAGARGAGPIAERIAEYVASGALAKDGL